MSYAGSYDDLLTALTAPQWKRIGIRRRSGVTAPLFSLYSSESLGIGDLFDLKLVVEWCKATGMSIIQLLPMNDVGFNFKPYDAQSTFALEPMYLRLQELKATQTATFKEDLHRIKEKFPIGTIGTTGTGSGRIDYRIKSEKLGLLWKIFQANPPDELAPFRAFCEKNAYWLEDYALFKVLKERNHETAWETWSEELRSRRPEALQAVRESSRKNLLFQKWLQWQLFEQFTIIKKYGQESGVYFMGDLPLLVARDSADVWARQAYFKLDMAAGAPPDMLYSQGQRWGMPAYNWDEIAGHNYDYLAEKLRYAENFYDMYRIDHVVGIFRLWSIPLSKPKEEGGLGGFFDPWEESRWEGHGRNLLSVMIRNTSMLACAEDLGTIPPVTYKVLAAFGIPGIDVQRWIRDWGKTYAFKEPDLYRKTAVATIATHDMSSLHAWWMFEAGTVDEELFKRKCREKNVSFDEISRALFELEKSSHGRLCWKKDLVTERMLLERLGLDETNAKDLIDLYKGSFDEKQKFLEFLGLKGAGTETFTPDFVKRALGSVLNSASIFSIQLLHDWLSLDTLFDCDPWDLRINFPGTMSDKNWSLVMPLSLEDILALPVNSVIREINKRSDRLQEENKPKQEGL